MVQLGYFCAAVKLAVLCITSTPFVADAHVLEKSMNTQAELRMRESVDQRI